MNPMNVDASSVINMIQLSLKPNATYTAKIMLGNWRYIDNINNGNTSGSWTRFKVDRPYIQVQQLI